MITFRCSDTFKELLSYLSSLYEMTKTDVIIQSVLLTDRNIYSIDPASKEMYQYLNSISNNLNQIAHALNKINRNSEVYQGRNLFEDDSNFIALAQKLDEVFFCFKDVSQEIKEKDNLYALTQKKSLIPEIEKIIELDPELAIELMQAERI